MTITKDRSKRITIQYTTRNYYDIPSTSSTNRVNRTLTNTVQYELMPNWRKIIKAHGNATTHIGGTFQILQSYPGFVWREMKTSPGQLGHPRNYRFTVHGNWIAGGLSFPTAGAYGSQAEAQNTAYIRFNKKCWSELRAIEGGVLIGELKETLSMLRSPAKALLGKFDKYITHVSKRNRGNRNKENAKKVIADSYLEASFGWKPFFNDISDAYKLYQRIGQAERSVKISAGATARREISKMATAMQGIGNTNVRDSAQVYEESHCRVKGEILTRAVTNTQTVLQQAGLTFDQFVPTIWELLPWSFLVDYFTNIGDILSYSNRVYSNLSWHCTGTRTDNVFVYLSMPDYDQMKKSSGTGFVGAGGSPCLSRLITRTVNRGVDPGVMTYSPTFQANISLSDNQLLNVSALLASANRTHPQRFRR